MELQEAIQHRRSIRRFLAKPVSDEIIKEPENRRLIIGAALGWPDTDTAVNCFERDRGAVEEFVQWVK